MEIRYFKHYSHHLNRDMEFKVYGHGGRPVLFIPCQAGRFWDFENFKMVDTWAKWIDAGECTVYSMDTIDEETYASTSTDYGWRSWRHECWYRYTVEELVPFIKHLNGERTGRDDMIMTFGASMGAMHAANLYFRRPDLFDSVLAISGLYEPGEYFNGYMDEILYQNSPNYYLRNMPEDHYYIDMYNNRKMVFVVGQGAWEEVLLASTITLKGIMENKGIWAQVDIWGHDVNHDWPWWYKMCDYYVPQFLHR